MFFRATPTYVSAPRASVAQVKPAQEPTARVLGSGPRRTFGCTATPLAAGGLAAAAVVTWARAVTQPGVGSVLAYNRRTSDALAYARSRWYGLIQALPVTAALLVRAIVPLALMPSTRVGTPFT
jgi:ABC-type sulfate transport system permease component